MSLESLGSLARTVSDRFLRENLRRIISGTNVSISSVLDGFRSHESQAQSDEQWAELLQCNEPQTIASAFQDLARGSSYARQGSDNLLKRRNSSIGRRSGQLSRDGTSRAPDLRTIYSAASLGYPVSPRAQKKPSHRQQQQQKQQTRWRWSRIITAAVFIAWTILGLCFLTGTWLPHHEPALVHDGQSQTGSWHLLSLLQPGSQRRLLEDNGAKLSHLGTKPHGHGMDAFSAAAVRMQEREQAGRWGQHMAGRMSRSLAERDIALRGEGGAAATAEAPSIAAATTFRSGAGSGQATTARAGAGNIANGAGAGAAEAERAAERASVTSGSGSGNGASVGGAAYVGASLLQQDTSNAATAQQQQQTTDTEGGANTLQYSNGYVNVTGPHYRVVEHTQNRDVCATACAGDAACAAWTRIAAGRPDVQACYLKSSVSDLAVSAAVQYVAPSQRSQVVLESGTKQPDALPAALYGCPYPPSRNGGCQPPPTCNCYQGVCYGEC